MAISTDHPTSTLRRHTTEAPSTTRIQQLIDCGTLYVAQNLSPSQFATLQAIASRILQPNDHSHHPERLDSRLDSALHSTSGYAPAFQPPPPVAFDHQVGLDELDTITRTRTGYSFAELPDEIQDAILSLIASRDLTTRKLDLALWLEDLQTSATVF